MIHLDRMRIGSRETAYPELCNPKTFWSDDRTPQAPSSPSSGDEYWEGTQSPLTVRKESRESFQPMNNIRVSASQEAKATIQQQSGILVEPPPKKKRKVC